MNTLEKEFVPYQESFDLKELGFDEPCLAVHYEHKCYPYSKSRGIRNSDKISQTWICTSPTFSQAFRWFREKYNLHYSIGVRDGIWFFDRWSFDGYKTYEEAELACLRKLIEIVKNTKP
jgi:hypothetical protein